MNIKNIVLGIAIFVVTIIVMVSGVNTLYKQPQYNDYCNESVNVFINNSEACIDAGGRWNPDYGPKPTVQGFCDLYSKCRLEFDTANEEFYKKVFLTAIPIGIVVIILGALIFGLEVVGAGLMAGGIGTIIYGVGGYWRYTENWMRFVISLIGLIALIWVAYYFNRKFKK
ncbi:MAG: hypothetical protein KKA64_00370 [Nanoarchaeota archaeon]|nr:hypothetical protein [Nanoarchaeota archaeon]